MERRRFEDSFKEAFKDAEVQPSEKVWTNVELDLIKAEGDKMKRRVLFYQLLAAASISFAVLFAGVGYFTLKENRSLEIALNNGRAIESENEDNNQSRIADSESPDGLQTDETRNNTLTDRPGNGEDPSPEPGLSSPGKDDLLAGRATGKTTLGNGVKNQNTHGDSDANSSAPSLQRSDARNVTAGQNTLATFDRDHSSNGETEGNIVGADGRLNDINEVRADANVVSDPGRSSVLKSNDGTPLLSSILSGRVADNGASPDDIDAPRRILPALYDATTPDLVFVESKSVEADPVALMFARLNDLEKELANSASEKKKVASREKLWTSVGFAAGAFNSMSSAAEPMAQAGPQFLASNTAAVQNQAKASGVAYSMGISMGAQVARRWVVQGGINYLTEMSNYTSTQAVQESGTFKAASVNQFRSSDAGDGARAEKFIPTAPYTVNNSNEYVSVPLQAGYLIVKRKLQWQLNAGVSTDLFIQNTVDPEGNIEKTTSGAGADSPFRTVNFSGLIGSEVSYRFGQHYRLGINPGIRYPLNSIYKEDLGLESSPLTFDVGLRFRYIFK